MATLRKKFGMHLREIRAQRRMTQEQFAEALGISVDFLSLVERGINAPSFDTLELPSGSGSPWPIYSPSNDARLS